MKKYEKTSLIDVDIEELFDFHTNPQNIYKITPKDTKVEILSRDFDFKEGEVLSIKTTKLFIPTFWTVEISLITKPSIIVDTALKSPFAFWRHSHIFSKKDDKSELKDVVEYELPLGALGNLADGFMRKELDSMFTYRHVQTKRILEKK